MKIQVAKVLVLLCLASCSPPTDTVPLKQPRPTVIPISSNQVISNEQNGLKLIAKAESVATTVAKGVTVNVVFTNTSTKKMVLMNHFDMCASGPFFGFRQYSPSLPNGHTDHYFKNSISVNNTDRVWIEIASGQSYVFTSPVSFEPPTALEVGNHTFRVIYFASAGSADDLLRGGDLPENLWTGQIMSEPVKVVIRE